MFGCYGAKVIELNIICMGNLYFPKELKLGKVKEATQIELKKIQERRLENKQEIDGKIRSTQKSYPFEGSFK